LALPGVLCGTAFFVAEEALSHPAAKARAISASGDMTIRSSVFDIARGYDWPSDWDLRTLRNNYLDRESADLERLRAKGKDERLAYAAAVERGDFDTAAVIVGEAVGLIGQIEPAAAIMRKLAADAERLLADAPSFLRTGAAPDDISGQQVSSLVPGTL
jgi:nitronate monooxygenase